MACNLFCSFEDLTVTPGEQIVCSGKVVPVEKCRNPGTPTLRLYYRELSKHPNIKNAVGEKSSLIVYEYHLIMARAGLFYEGTEGLNICKIHRDKLGWKWQRPDKSCYHPEHETWSKTVRSYERTLGVNVVTLDLSKKLFRDYGTLLPIGTGICDVCFNKEKVTFRMPCEDVGEAFTTSSFEADAQFNLKHEMPRIANKEEAETGFVEVESEAYPICLTKVNPDGSGFIETDGHFASSCELNENGVENTMMSDKSGLVASTSSESDLKEPSEEVEGSLCNIVFHVCTSCLQGFESEEELKEHRVKMHGEKVPQEGDSKTHKCEVCSETFDDYVDLCTHHFLKHHVDDSQQNQIVEVTGLQGYTNKKRKHCNRDAGPSQKRIITQGQDPNCALTESELDAMFEFLVPSVQLKVNFSAWDHTCRFCHKSFIEYEPYRLHLRTHRIDGNISCPICGDEFECMRLLYEHMKAHEEENSAIKSRRGKPKFCDHCCYIFSDSFIKTRGCLIEGKEHSEVAMSHVCVFCIAACSCTMDFPADGFLPVPYRCEVALCFAVFQLESDMALHCYYNHDECHICGYHIPNMQKDSRKDRCDIYEDHLRVTHKCPKCGKMFKIQKEKTRHILEEHKQPQKKVKGRPSNKKCYSCGATFKKIEEKKQHVESYCPVLKKKTRVPKHFEGMVMPEGQGSDVKAVPLTIQLNNRRGLVYPKKLHNPFVCLFCMNLLKTQLDFDVHKVTCKPILKCTSCEMNLRESEGFDFHARSCENCRTFSCVMCRKFTGEPEVAFEHARLCKKKSSFMMAICTKCKQRVSSYEDAQIHRCPTIEEVCEKKQALVGKKKKEVDSKTAVETKKSKPAVIPGEYRCRYCGLNLPRKVSSHELYCTYNTAKSRRMIYGCDYCNVKYNTRDERDVHLMTCLRGKCDFCHENFGNEGHRIMHMRGCHYKPKTSTF
ncbi:zinc finger protein 26-like [Lineus longissimus]|uniref:zinc finger protein 26-like n=1 Tax=Lineus longissimus TaxID=88925 RepID=UPI00315D23E7